MKKILFSMLALGAMTGAALAEPQKMNEGQLEGVAGGQDVSVNQTNWLNHAAFALALGGGQVPVSAEAKNEATQTNTSAVDISSTVPGFPNGGNGTNGSGGLPVTVPPISIDLPDLGMGGAQ
jgi:hypothetical protein